MAEIYSRGFQIMNERHWNQENPEMLAYMNMTTGNFILVSNNIVLPEPNVDRSSMMCIVTDIYTEIHQYKIASSYG